jgi:hypothetical protein
MAPDDGASIAAAALWLSEKDEKVLPATIELGRRAPEQEVQNELPAHSPARHPSRSGP